MNKTTVIAFAVRLLSEKSTLIAKPDAFTEMLNSIMGVEPYDVRVARAIEADFEKASTAAKNAITNHKFKKLTKNL